MPGAEIGRRDVEVPADLRRRPLGERAPAVEDVDAVADLHDQRDVVVDQQHARAEVVADGADDGGEGGDLGLVQPGRRLVHQHEPRLERERPRDAEPALVAVRQDRGRARRRARARPSSSSSSVGAPPRLARARRPRAERRDLDVLAHGEAAEQPPVLERPREPGAAAPVRRPARDLASPPSSIRPDDGRSKPVRRLTSVVFPAPFGPIRPSDLVGRELEVDVLERVNPLE